MKPPLIDIRPDHWEIVRDILRRHVPNLAVWAFGSRAKWTAKDYSDLDLAIITGQPLSLSVSASLSDDFSESDLPFKVDVVDWATTSASFRKIIEQDKVDLLLHDDPLEPKLAAHIRQHGKPLGWHSKMARGRVDEGGAGTADRAGVLRMLRLGNVCTKIGCGATPRGGSDVYLSSGIALIRSQNIYNDGFRTEGLAFIGDEHAAQLANVEVEAGDILLNITGDSVARSCRVPETVLPARVNQHVAIIRPNPEELDPRYLHYHLISPAKQRAMHSLAGGGATRNALTKGMIEHFEVPAPSLDVQRAIAGVLGALDDKIEQNRRTARALERLARAIFRAWFVDFEPVKAKAEGRTAFPGMPQPVFDALPTRFVASAIGPVPEGWVTGRLGDLIEIHDSRRIPLSRRQREERPGPYPYYGAAGIVDYVNEFLFDGVFVLVGEDGTVVSDGDRPMVQYVWGQFWVNNHAHVLTGASGYTTEHLRVLLDHVNIRPFVTGAVQPKLNQGNLKSVPVILAPRPVVEEFGNTIAPSFHLLRLIENGSRKLAAMRDYLLPKLISGELRVKAGWGAIYCAHPGRDESRPYGGAV